MGMFSLEKKEKTRGGGRRHNSWVQVTEGLSEGRGTTCLIFPQRAGAMGGNCKEADSCLMSGRTDSCVGMGDGLLRGGIEFPLIRGHLAGAYVILGIPSGYVLVTWPLQSF